MLHSKCLKFCHWRIGSSLQGPWTRNLIDRLMGLVSIHVLQNYYRYVFKRLAGFLHLMTTLVIWIVIEVIAQARWLSASLRVSFFLNILSTVKLKRREYLSYFIQDCPKLLAKLKWSTNQHQPIWHRLGSSGRAPVPIIKDCEFESHWKPGSFILSSSIVLKRTQKYGHAANQILNSRLK